MAVFSSTKSLTFYSISNNKSIHYTLTIVFHGFSHIATDFFRDGVSRAHWARFGETLPSQMHFTNFSIIKKSCFLARCLANMLDAHELLAGTLARQP